MNKDSGSSPQINKLDKLVSCLEKLTPKFIPSVGGVLAWLVLIFLCGLVNIILFATQSLFSSNPQHSDYQFLSIIGVGFLLAASFLVSGMLIGFIFGIPRILSQESFLLEVSTSNGIINKDNPNGKIIEDDSNNNKNEKKPIQNSIYGENSNLDQISDWLTKILVGVGLTQLTRVPETLQQYSEIVKPALGNFPSSGIFGIVILIFFSVDGFLIGYIWTRRSAAVEFTKAKSEQFNEIEKMVQESYREAKGAVKQAQEANRLAQEVDERTKNDFEAISFVKSILYSIYREQPVDQEELNEKIQKASKGARAQIFYDAAEMRSKNWSENKPLMERTIPIFRALIASDTENRYHRNHGQLGFALKDKQKPDRADWVEAFNELTRAIEIRGPWEYGDYVNWLYYELVRAICRISLDEEFNNNRPSEPEVRELILKDISYAGRDPKMSYIMSEDQSILKWMKLNNLDIRDYVHLEQVD